MMPICMMRRAMKRVCKIFFVVCILRWRDARIDAKSSAHDGRAS
ncbi:MAG: hypothetical protein RL033_1914 [Pseudomonadota bacterium]